MFLRFLTIDFYGHTAVVSQILLKYQVKSLKYKLLEHKSTFYSFVSDKLNFSQLVDFDADCGLHQLF